MTLPVLSDIEAHVRSGRGSTARAMLRGLDREKLPRAQVVAIAALARRAGMADLGLRLLNPLVRTGGRRPATATDPERAEYAACLVREGAAEEATQILRGLDPKQTPEASLYLAFALVARWEYRASIAPLESFLAGPGGTPYAKLIARVNLLAALVEESEYARAEALIPELLDVTSREALWLLHGNVLDYAAQSSIFQARWDEAGERLQRAGQALAQSGGPDELFIRKWKAVAALLEHGESSGRLAALEEVRSSACARQHWETVRSCDFYKALATRSASLLRYVFFGTPFPSFRARMKLTARDQLTLPERYEWTPMHGEGAMPSLDLVSLRGPLARSSGKLLLRLARLLSSDFYRPFRIASLHAGLYPDEHYDPASSPGRVHQILRRFRDWCAASSLPLTVTQQGKQYRLLALAPCRIQLPTKPPEALEETHHTLKLRSTWPQGTFSLTEAHALLGLSRRAVLYLLQDELQRGEILRSGRGPATRYRFKSAG